MSVPEQPGPHIEQPGGLRLLQRCPEGPPDAASAVMLPLQPAATQTADCGLHSSVAAQSILLAAISNVAAQQAELLGPCFAAWLVDGPVAAFSVRSRAVYTAFHS